MTYARKVIHEYIYLPTISQAIAPIHNLTLVPQIASINKV